MNHTMTPRQEAMNWWNRLSSSGKSELCKLYDALVGEFRTWESLTGREIENIYKEEFPENEIIMTKQEERPYWECPVCGDNMENIFVDGMDTETIDGSTIEYYKCNECGHTEEQVIKFD